MKVNKLFFISLFLLSIACSKNDVTETTPFIILKTGDEFTPNNAYVPIGGQLKFGLSAVGDHAAITNLTIKRITENSIITELDKGMYVKSGGLDTTVTFVKGAAEQETWKFAIMNDHRDTASVIITIYKGEGSAYGPIDYFPSITIGYQNNSIDPNYVDLNSGTAYNNSNITGNESSIDLVSYYYLSSGLSSPTLSCPSYPTARSYYPVMNDWLVQNAILYDYYTTDNSLINSEEFDASQNDSLLVNGYIPTSVSGTCKYCIAGKIIPFKTGLGKYGLIKVIHADEVETGSMEIAVKIQK